MADLPVLLARGPWPLDAIEATWLDEAYAPSQQHADAADDAIAALKERGSPSHDGTAARLVDFTHENDRLHVTLQPMRWALRLVAGDTSGSLSALCVIRDSEGRWLAGRRAAWLASWPSRWALGAGGAVDPGESPATTLTRELDEEWSVTPERVRGEALIRMPNDMVMFVGQAWLAPGTQVTPDHEHDAYAWWPADPDDWPDEADEPLRRAAKLVA